MSSTVVTLSSAAEATAVITHSRAITRNGRPRARFAAQIATYSNTPVWRSTPTITIIPKSRKTTFQSIPVSSEKKVSSGPTMPTARTTPAPASAATTRLTFSEAISA